jgi:site-specific DNA recombinase
MARGVAREQPNQAAIAGVAADLAALQQMTPADLAEKYAALFGAPPRSRNKNFLRKRLAWRIQELAEGGLSERALARIEELGPAALAAWRRPARAGTAPSSHARPAFQRLLADIEAGQIDVVVVYKVDRLSRSLLDFAKLMERFGAAGTSFVSVTQNFSTADAMGRLTLNMLMSFAEFEREMIGERTRDKIAAQRRRGKWTGGTVPLGYSVEGKRLVVNDLEAVLVREVFSLYLQQRSTLAVARLLNEAHRSTKRHVAANGRLREARPWTKADVTRLLRNPVYAGYMSSHGELHDGEHEPIVDRETFSQVRELLDGGSRPTKEHSRNADYILRGLLRCARCGSAFTPASTRKGHTEYRYYRCM